MYLEFAATSVLDNDLTLGNRLCSGRAVDREVARLAGDLEAFAGLREDCPDAGDLKRFDRQEHRTIGVSQLEVVDDGACWSVRRDLGNTTALLLTRRPLGKHSMSEDLLREGLLREPFVSLDRSDLRRQVVVRPGAVARESWVLGDVKRSIEDGGVKLVVAYASDNEFRRSMIKSVLLTSPDRLRSRAPRQGPRHGPRHPRPC